MHSKLSRSRPLTSSDASLAALGRPSSCSRHVAGGCALSVGRLPVLQPQCFRAQSSSIESRVPLQSFTRVPRSRTAPPSVLSIVQSSRARLEGLRRDVCEKLGSPVTLLQEQIQGALDLSSASQCALSAQVGRCLWCRLATSTRFRAPCVVACTGVAGHVHVVARLELLGSRRILATSSATRA